MMKTKIIVRNDIVLGLLFVFFFCSRIAASVITRSIGSESQEQVYAIIFFLLLFLCVIKGKNNVFVPTIIYSGVALVIFVTYLIHPEYSEWFSHQTYGIAHAFLNPSWGIWAFAVVWLVRYDKDLYSYLRISVWLLFVFLVLEFAMANHRGYWAVLDLDGSTKISEYDMEFGYNMLFPVSFFGTEAVLKKKPGFLLPWLIGFILILLGGSRGPVVWIPVIFIFLLPFVWRGAGIRKRVMIFIILTSSLIICTIVLLNYKSIASSLLVWFSKRNISSRTINSLLSGTFSDKNGRDKIYSMAIELIRTGGPFGRGVYGDRYYIGNYFRWGYSHNIFLELLVSFGYVGGSVLILLFVYGIVLLYRHSKMVETQIVFITFLSTSMKLILSNSFWYNSAFWALLVMMIKTRMEMELNKRRRDFLSHTNTEMNIKLNL